MGRTAVLVVVLMILVISSDVRAEFYKWVDRNGREFITNDKEKIPAENRGAAKLMEVRDDRVSIGIDPVADQNKPEAVLEHKDKYGRGEQYWRKRAESVRRQLQKQEDERELLVKQERNDESKTKKRSSSSTKKTKSSRDKKMAKIDKKIAKLRRELDVDLPKEARKADAYPGWLRD